jgi:putative Holliday junction resolvase
MSLKNYRKIGLDLGSKSCGICISSYNNEFATPICNLVFAENDFDKIITKLKIIIEDYDYKVDVFVLGISKNMNNNSETKSSIRSKNFALILKEKFSNIDVIFVDENYSTKQATESLMEFNIKSSKRKKIIDQVSSLIILERYLSSNKF